MLSFVDRFVQTYWLEMIRHDQVGDWRLRDDEFLREFRLPTARDKVESLKELHPLSRDERIQFDEASHTYTVDGVLVPLSVTGLIHSYIRAFDPMEAISVMKPETRQRYIDQGFASEADIMSSWTRNGAVALSYRAVPELEPRVPAILAVVQWHRKSTTLSNGAICVQFSA